MLKLNSLTIKLIAHLGWILTFLGGIFAIWLFLLILRLGENTPSIMTLFSITFIFCSVAVGQFFVVLNIIVEKLQNIENNTKAIKEIRSEQEHYSQLT